MTKVRVGKSGNTGPLAVDIDFADAGLAAAAQAAVAPLDGQIDGQKLPAVAVQAGSDTIPATVPAVALFVEGTQPYTVQAPATAVLVAVSASAPVTIVGAAPAFVGGALQTSPQTVVAGSGGVVYENQSPTVHGYFAGSPANGANIIVDMVAPMISALGSTPTTQTFDVAGLVFADNESQFNETLDIEAHDGATVVAISGSTVIHALSGNETIVAAPRPTTMQFPPQIVGQGGNVVYFPLSGSGSLSLGAGNTTVFGGAGRTTVLPQSGVASGSLTVVGANGLFQGGSAGGNLMFTSTVPGQTALEGGGNGDLLVAQATGDALSAGAGNETLFALGEPGTFFGGGDGRALMVADGAGGNTFGFGQVDGPFGNGMGQTTVLAAHAQQSRGNLFDVNLHGGAVYVGGFVSGVDSLQGYSPGRGDHSGFFDYTYDATTNSTVVRTADNTTILFFNAKVTASDVY